MVSISKVAAIGCPKWGLRFTWLKRWHKMRPHLLIVVDTPKRHYEVRLYIRRLSED